MDSHLINVITFQTRNNLQYIKEDTAAVERHRVYLYRARDRYSVKPLMLSDVPTPKLRRLIVDRSNGGIPSGSRSSFGGLAAGGFQNKKIDVKAQRSHGQPREDDLSGLDSLYISHSSLAVTRKKRIHVQVCSIIYLFVMHR